jgi:hypothetical protein
MGRAMRMVEDLTPIQADDAKSRKSRTEWLPA